MFARWTGGEVILVVGSIQTPLSPNRWGDRGAVRGLPSLETQYEYRLQIQVVRFAENLWNLQVCWPNEFGGPSGITHLFLFLQTPGLRGICL